MVAVLLFIAAGFVFGWAVQHPLAWAVLLLPITFAVAAGSDLAVIPAILGIALTALAVLAGRALAQRRSPTEPAERRPEEPAERSPEEPAERSRDESAEKSSAN